MASAVDSNKMRILLIPFFATSHIGPFTNLAIRLCTACQDAIEATIAVTPANLPVALLLLEQRGHAAGTSVKTVTYPFPAVEGLPPGVENMSMATPENAWRIDAAAYSEVLTRPLQEALVREQSPDAIVTDMHFFWNAGVADDLGIPCVTFQVAGAFPALAMRHLVGGDVNTDVDAGVVTVPRFPAPDIRIPLTELPEFVRKLLNREYPPTAMDKFFSAQGRCFGLVVNTFFGLEEQYCELTVRNGYARRAYFVGPIALSLPAAGGDAKRIMDWLDAKPSRSVVYVCFGSLAPVSDAQLHELALGLEAAGQPFLWVVRAEQWSTPEGWAERIGEKGMVVRAWAPQTAILGHPSVGAFVTHCGWNSILETVAAGVPVLTWPIVFEQFIIERLVTEVLGIGQRLWPGARSTKFQESETIPGEAVAQAVTRFMRPGGQGDMARGRVEGLSAKAHAAMAQSGSSVRDLKLLIDHLVEARAAAAGAGTTFGHSPVG